MRLYLIGLPGVGKSTIGKNLAKRLSFEFIDLDTYIEQEAMLFVDEIFHLYGEEYFRALEHNLLIEASKKDNVVIACGGGIIKDPSNKEAMRGTCILLYSDLDLIEERLNESTIERPLLMSKSLKDLANEREALYEQFADIKIENKNQDAAIEEIIGRLKQ